MRRRSTTPKIPTRDRILDAAIRRFARTSYEQTGLRDIAADAGVDVAYVHRCFGSKERLFAEAVRTAMEPADVLTAGADDLARKLAKHVVSTQARRAVGLDIIVRSLSSPEASRVLRQSILNDFLIPLAGKLDEAPRRLALIVAFMAGVDIFRNVLRIPPLLERNVGELESLIASTISSILSSDATSSPNR
jgi:AcrR family transcriptional regulator